MTKITKENMQNAHDELLKTFVNKNADYGNSFESSLEEYGLIAALIRMEDKMGRLRTLIKSEAKVKDESISDTLRDLSNYALMASVWFDHKDDDDRPASERVDELFKRGMPSLGFYSGLRVVGSGEHFRKLKDPDEVTREIEIQNSEQLRLYLNIHKEKGALSVANGIGRDLFYRIDFTDFYQYVKELRGVRCREGETLQIYFNVRNDDLNKVIYICTNKSETAYHFDNIKHFKAAIENFIYFKKYLLNIREELSNTREQIKTLALKQGSTLIKPRTRIDDAFIEFVLCDNDEISFDLNRGVFSEGLLDEQFIYDMYENTVDPSYGKYQLILDDEFRLNMESTLESTLETFLSQTFLDSFQRVLNSGKTVKIINIPQ